MNRKQRRAAEKQGGLVTPNASPGVQDAFDNAVRRHQAGRVQDAERLYRQVLEIDPRHADSLHLLGVIAAQTGRHDAAVDLIKKAIKVNGNVAPYHFNLGLALMKQERVSEAAACFRRAVGLKPDYPEAYSNLGNAFRKLGQPDEAVACYRRAIDFRPNYLEVYNNLGTILQELGRPNEAIACFHRTIDLDSNASVPYHNLGLALNDLQKFEEAVAAFRGAVARAPGNPSHREGLGDALYQAGHIAEATEHYRTVLAGHNNAAVMLKFCMYQLANVHAGEDDILRRRDAYGRHLADLTSFFAASSLPAAVLAEAIGSAQPFYLPYQGMDDRELQEMYGRLICGVMDRAFGMADIAPPPMASEKVRIGIVSGLYYDHSVWKIPVKGWLSHLDRERFELFAFHTGAKTDDATAEARGLADHFVQGPLSLAQWREAILAKRPHVLIYPEIGMDGMSARLAAMRLAKVQCNALGHPVTSGMPTIDLYLSSDLMEPEDGQRHYSELLVRLPNLSVVCEPKPAPAEAVDRSALGIDGDAVVYWSCQSLFKYLPQYDLVFPRIANAVPNARFLFIANHGAGVTETFRNRLEQAFAANGLSFDRHCTFVERMNWRRFMATARLCDVFLDGIGWSGFNTTTECLSYDLPVVTMPTAFMRGRHSAAVMRMIGVEDTIAHDVDDYVAKAARLGTDPEWRTAIRDKIAANKHRLYGDMTCIRALEDVLDRFARDPSPFPGDSERLR